MGSWGLSVLAYFPYLQRCGACLFVQHLHPWGHPQFHPESAINNSRKSLSKCLGLKRPYGYTTPRCYHEIFIQQLKANSVNLAAPHWNSPGGYFRYLLLRFHSLTESVETCLLHLPSNSRHENAHAGCQTQRHLQSYLYGTRFQLETILPSGYTRQEWNARWFETVCWGLRAAP